MGRYGFWYSNLNVWALHISSGTHFMARFTIGFFSPQAAIAQSVVIDEFTGERRAKATSIYMMGVGIPATVAPIISGYVCEELSWSWVFFILLPVAFLALFGLLKSIKPDPPSPRNITLDWIGFISLAVMIACIQLVLDRGEREEW